MAKERTGPRSRQQDSCEVCGDMNHGERLAVHDHLKRVREERVGSLTMTWEEIRARFGVRGVYRWELDGPPGSTSPT